MVQKRLENGVMQDDRMDASVIVKWFSEEEYTDKALEIRERIRMVEESVIVPDLLL